MRRDLSHLPPLLCAVLLLLWGGRAAALSDSRDPVEPAPLARLGPPVAEGARVSPTGVELQVLRTRRSLRVRALFSIEAPPGPLRLNVPSTEFQVRFDSDGTSPQVEQVQPLGELAEQPPDVRVCPRTGRIYAYGQGPAGPPRMLYRHTILVTVPASGRLLLSATATLSSGFDRQHWRRQVVELTHALHLRSDFFVYQFAVAGPGGRIRLQVPPHTSAWVRRVSGVLRTAAAEPRPFPLAATVGLGVAVSGPGAGSSEGPVAQGLLRVGLDLLLRHGDALSLSGEGGTAFTGRHHAGVGLTYQLYSPWLPFSLLPIGGHLDLGASLDVWPTLRGGPRVGVGLNLSAVGLWIGADLFPERVPPAPQEGGPDRYHLNYRVAILATVGL